MNDIYENFEHVIRGWQCPACFRRYVKRNDGVCYYDQKVLKPIVPQIAEN